MNPKILIVGGILKTVRKAKALGLDVLYFQKKTLYSAEHAPFVDHVTLFDYEDDSLAVPIARSLAQLIPFGCVLSLTEPGLLPAARINDALQLGGTSYRTAHLLIDKWEMRQHLNEHGFSRVQAAQGRSRADLEAFIRLQGFPVFVKPVDGSASRGVSKITTDAQIDAAFSALSQAGCQRFIVEEFLEGPEISVESFSFNGFHVIIAITGKLCSEKYIEIGHVVPAEVPTHIEEQVSIFVRAFLDLIGLRNGPAHTEVKVTPLGLRIVESHNRIGGDRINELVELAYGIDMDMLTLAWPFGLVEPLRERPPRHRTAAVRFFTVGPGFVESVAGLEEARAVDGVVEVELAAAAGTIIKPITSSMERIGHVIATGADAGEAAARCEGARDLVRFTLTTDS